MRLLISAHTGLGNFVLKTPLIRYINKNYPDALIDIIGGGKYGADYVLSQTGLINNSHNYSNNSSFLHKLSIKGLFIIWF